MDRPLSRPRSSDVIGELQALPKVVTVYRSGGDFTAEDVRILFDQVAQHATVTFSPVVLTDRPDEDMGIVTRVNLTEDWPGFWSKLELFKLTGPVLYMDLDTMVVGNIDALLEANLAHGIVYGTKTRKPNKVLNPKGFGSSVMMWNGLIDLPFKPYKFQARKTATGPRYWAHTKPNRKWLGDQNYTQANTTVSFLPFPGIYSYKNDIRGQEALPDDACIVYFHGVPRPRDINWKLP